MVKNSFHLRSMTAYGRSAASFDYGQITVEVATLNRRHLEVNLSLPKMLSHLEMDLRKKIGAKVARGQVNLTVNWNFEGKKPVRLVPNVALAKELIQGWEVIAEQTGLAFDLSLLKESQLFFEELVEEKISAKTLNSTLDQAIEALLEMKLKEGSELGVDLASSLASFEKKLATIEQNVPEATEKYRKKLCERMESLFGEVDERVFKEIALYAEKVDISEEIVRAKSHMSQFFQILEAPFDGLKEVKGKVLEFLCQELLRETNTIGSKALDVKIAKLVIEMKGELEKIREQVQNVE